MDTKALRQKILDLAIHGKLVPQDPNDEPASVLLERIKAEKERLIKEGKIKRSKKSAKSSDTPHYETCLFELPNGWEWCRFGRYSLCCVWKYGTSDKSCLSVGRMAVPCDWGMLLISVESIILDFVYSSTIYDRYEAVLTWKRRSSCSIAQK